MKKRILALALGMLFLVSFVAACDSGGDDPRAGVEILGTINLWSFTPELPDAVAAFIELNPEFPYNVNPIIINDQGGSYEQALNAALMAGGASAPDIFVVEQAFVVNYTQFDYSDYALPYEDLFGAAELQSMLNAAEIGNFIVQAGTNPDGKLVGLGYQSTGSAFIYRRSLAKEIWGTDDPLEIQKKVGPGWDQLLVAAKEADAKGIKILAGEGDLWQAIRQSPEQWVQDGKLVIDAQRMSYLDIGYELYNNNYTNKTGAWTDAWWADMNGTGEAPVLGFLGPAWLINYCMAPNAPDTAGDFAICVPPVGFAWGGSFSIANKGGNEAVRAGVAEIIKWITLDISDDGMQYYWANGIGPVARDTGDTVASGAVMARSDGTNAYLGGQDMFDVFVPAGEAGDSRGWGPYDRAIDELFNQHATQYFNGSVTKDEAIAAFKQEVLDTLGIGS